MAKKNRFLTKRSAKKNSASSIAYKIHMERANEFDVDRDVKETWDDVNVLRDEFLKSAAKLGLEIGAINNNPLIKDNMNDEEKKEFESAFNTFFHDHNQYLTDLQKIAEGHVGKVGKVANMEEYNLLIKSFADYREVNMRFRLLIQPTIGIMEMNSQRGIKRANEAWDKAEKVTPVFDDSDDEIVIDVNGTIEGDAVEVKE